MVEAKEMTRFDSVMAVTSGIMARFFPPYKRELMETMVVFGYLGVKSTYFDRQSGFLSANDRDKVRMRVGLMRKGFTLEVAKAVDSVGRIYKNG